MSSCCGSSAVILIAVLSAISYLATPYTDQTIGDEPWALAYLAKNGVSNVVNSILGTHEEKKTLPSCREFQHESEKITVCWVHKTPHRYDYMFSYAGCGACVLMLFGVFSNNTMFMILGFLGKMIVDIVWPIMIYNGQYDSSSYGYYFFEKIIGRETIPQFWFIHICLKAISAIIILSYISSMSTKNTPRRGVNYNYVP